MIAAPPKTEKPFRKAFLHGLVAVAIVYAFVYAWIAINSGSTLQKIQDSLPSKIMLIDHGAMPAEAVNYPPAPAPVSAVEQVSEEPEQTQEEAETVEIPTGPLAAAPISGFYDTTVEGMLPKISAEGKTPFDVYKRPFPPTTAPKIALAVKNYGLSASDSDKALALPPEVSLILSPYSNDPELWQRKARESGHEVWLWLPIENLKFLEDDPGPRALLTRSSLTDNQKKLTWLMMRATGYVGLAAETDKAFTDVHAMLGDLLTSAFARGVGYLELNPAGSELVETLALSKNAPFIGASQSIDTINANTLTNLEERARKSGSAVGIVELSPKNIDELREWSLMLMNKGVVLAPVSAVAADNPLVKPDEAAQSGPANAITIHHE